MKKNKNKKSKKIFILLMLILVIALVVFAYIKFYGVNPLQEMANKNTYGDLNQIDDIFGDPVTIKKDPIKVEMKNVEIYKGTDRPIAIMIDNHDDARPQVSINKAYVVYEIIVEGGYTRMMPIFKGQDIDQIGPVRSARHYFLDYALENDAIYVHFGQSPQAGNDIQKLNVNDIEGIYYSSNEFKRVKGKYAPHNVMVSTDSISDIIKRKDYRSTSDEKSVLKYNANGVNLNSENIATEVNIPFSNSQKVTFEYDEENKVYTKYANGKKQVDWVTKEDVTFKNIIVTFIENYTLDDPENKGRQGLKNTGTKDGYYITEGKAIKITCTKETRASKTVYKDLDGKEIEVNDGNTYIGICPLDAKVTIEPGEEATDTEE